MSFTPDALLALAPVRARRTSLLGPRRRKRPQKRLRALREPRAEELRYTGVLRRVVAQAVALVRERLLPRLPALLAEADRLAPTERGDDASDTLADILEGIWLALGLSEERARRMAVEMLERVQRRHATEFVTLYEESLAVNPLAGSEPWLREQMSLAVKENAELIKSLPEDMLFEVRGIVNRGVLDGTRSEDLAKLIAHRFDVTESRAVLIARDQVGKWQGSLTRLRHLDAGVTEYIFSTSQDERVRPGHRALNGTVQSWSKPPVVDPKTGRRAHPGMDVRCRCVAIPRLDEDEEDT